MELDSDDEENIDGFIVSNGSTRRVWHVSSDSEPELVDADVGYKATQAAQSSSTVGTAPRPVLDAGLVCDDDDVMEVDAPMPTDASRTARLSLELDDSDSDDDIEITPMAVDTETPSAAQPTTTPAGRQAAVRSVHPPLSAVLSTAAAPRDPARRSVGPYLRQPIVAVRTASFGDSLGAPVEIVDAHARAALSAPAVAHAQAAAQVPKAAASDAASDESAQPPASQRAAEITEQLNHLSAIQAALLELIRLDAKRRRPARQAATDEARATKLREAPLPVAADNGGKRDKDKSKDKDKEPVPKRQPRLLLQQRRDLQDMPIQYPSLKNCVRPGRPDSACEAPDYSNSFWLSIPNEEIAPVQAHIAQRLPLLQEIIPAAGRAQLVENFPRPSDEYLQALGTNLASDAHFVHRLESLPGSPDVNTLIEAMPRRFSVPGAGGPLPFYSDEALARLVGPGADKRLTEALADGALLHMPFSNEEAELVQKVLAAHGNPPSDQLEPVYAELAKALPRRAMADIDRYIRGKLRGDLPSGQHFTTAALVRHHKRTRPELGGACGVAGVAERLETGVTRGGSRWLSRKHIDLFDELPLSIDKTARGQIVCMSLHPTQNKLLVGSIGAARNTSVEFEPGEAVLYDLDRGTRIVLGIKGKAFCSDDYDGHRDAVPAVAFSASGRFGLTVGYDNQLKVWDMGGQLITNLGGPFTAVHAELDALDPQFERLISASTHGTNDALACVASKRRLALWDIHNKEQVRVLQWADLNELSFCYGRYADHIVACRSLEPNDPRGRKDLVIRWDVTTDRRETLVGERNGPVHTEDVELVCLSPLTDTLLLTGSDDGTVAEFDMRQAGPQKRYVTFGHNLMGALALSHCDTYVAVSDEDSRVIVFDRRRHQQPLWVQYHEVERPPGPKSQGIEALRWGPSSGLLFSGGEDGVVRTWDVHSGIPQVKTFRRPDGDKMAIGSGSLVIGHREEYIVCGYDDSLVQLYGRAGSSVRLPVASGRPQRPQRPQRRAHPEPEPEIEARNMYGRLPNVDPASIVEYGPLIRQLLTVEEGPTEVDLEFGTLDQDDYKITVKDVA
eukprot:TRINITY_DN30923_c0_g1_i1.p1 TRINITY_DN30923_c0_g1~~TRINITY_DN30923_c0_g1_i1.p1  ORF type:complete len:1073 (+),score=307.13 TRINITY_DN30923_c0_g1_i1:365-3583(+)